MPDSKPVNIRTTSIILAICWSIIMLSAMAVDMYNSDRSVMAMAKLQARTAIAKDILYRKWNAINGGLYGTRSELTQPNPFLNVPDRDISTPSGRQLTLINPAYMTRQVHELELQQENGLRSHITSINPIRPANAPDTWEQTALRRLEYGDSEVSTLAEINGQPYLRVIRPLRVTNSCLKCHAAQGYGEGDLRGGISASVPMREWNLLKRQHLLRGYLLYLAFWLVGLLGLGGGMYQLRRQIRSNQMVSEQLGQFKTTLDRINDYVFMLDPQSLYFFYANQMIIDKSGYSEEELLHMTPSDLFQDLEGDHVRQMVNMLQNGSRDYFHFESTVQYKNGTIIPVDIQLQHIEPTRGNDRVVGVMRDISKRKKMELEKQQMEQRLMQTQKFESVGQLAAGIAHEINTPAQFVGTNIEFLDEAFWDVDVFIQCIMKIKDNAPAEVANRIDQALKTMDWEYLGEELPIALDQSRDGVERIRSIVLAMKNFSRPGTSVKILQSLNQIIETTVTVTGHEWKHIAELELKLDPDLPDLPLLANEIGQVILNLLINASHSIGEKLDDNSQDIKGTITLSTRHVDEMVEIRIRDTGIGIPEKIRERIFDPFFTTKEVGKGTGQGLAITRDIIVNKHGGILEVESIEGAGATFIIRLPLN